MLVSVTTATRFGELHSFLGVPRGKQLGVFCLPRRRPFATFDKAGPFTSYESMLKLMQHFDSQDYSGEDIFLAPYGTDGEWIKGFGIPIASVR